MKPCKSCPRPAMPQCSQCVDCHVKRLWKDEYWEMVGRHIAEAEMIPFAAPSHDSDWTDDMEACKSFVPVYVYRGDRLTDESLKGMLCIPVKQANGKCITGKTATMLVEDVQGVRHVVLRRQLRKVKAEIARAG